MTTDTTTLTADRLDDADERRHETLQFRDPFTLHSRTVTLCLAHRRDALRVARAAHIGVSGTWAGSLASCDACANNPEGGDHG